MLTLNLVNEETSDLKFEVSKFPDGQQQVKVIVGTAIKETSSIETIQIKARLNNFQDLELIICATKSLRNLGFKYIRLFVPYFLGSRSDRQFEEGSNNYLKSVICPIINSLEFESVTVVDPHSDVLEGCLNNFRKINNKEVVNWALFSILDGIYPNSSVKQTINQFILLAPDAGAAKKIFKTADFIGFTGDVITCSKDRNTSGELSKTTVPLRDRHKGKDFIIIDDICDGGATFINIAEIISQDKSFDDSKIYLIITHGIFSRGLDILDKYFDGIYCTNSYSDVGKLQQHLFNLKQLDVFLFNNALKTY